MKPCFKTLTLLLVIFSTTALVAQEVILLGNLSLPVGGYGKSLGDDPHVTRRSGFDVGDGAGFATEGFGIGTEFSFPVKFKGVSWITGLTLVINGTNDEELTQTFKQLLGGEDIKFNYGRWIQMPVMTGFKYSLSLGCRISFYGMVQGGINFIHTATRKATASDVTVDERTYEFSREFGYGLGGGLVVNKKYDLGVRFFDFGDAMFDGTRNLSMTYFGQAYDMHGRDAILGQKIPVSFLLMSLGYHF
jgi:hypothetical protein